MLFFMISGLAVLYYFQTLIADKKIIKKIKIDSEASLILNRMQHTSTRNGVKEWTLEATSAKVLKNEDKVLITNISLVFFMPKGEQVEVTAKNGYINMGASDIDLSDNIVVTYKTSVLTTDRLHYEKKSHIIYSNEHVTITNAVSANYSAANNSSVLKSDTMKIDLNNNSLELKGNVYAILSDSLDFSE